MPELNNEEIKAIASLKGVAKKWPESLWLFSANGTLCVMKYKANGETAIDQYGCMDQEYIVDNIRGIANDGGDW